MALLGYFLLLSILFYVVFVLLLAYGFVKVPHCTSDIPNDLTSDLASNVTSNITSDVTSNITSENTSCALSEEHFESMPVVSTGFSIVIPFRNESEALPGLLASIGALDYKTSNFEVILINDGSTDDSLKKINAWRFENPFVALTVLDNVVVSGSPKKDAITRAISIAKFPWIATTDADCVVPEKWLSLLNEHIAKTADAGFVMGSVYVIPKKGFLNAFQISDFHALQATTIGAYGLNEAFMCNGAHLCYKKSLFNEVRGYEGVNKMSSGDDVFLLQKVLNLRPEVVSYFKSADAAVGTLAVNSWSDLIAQHVRWGKKASSYSGDFPKILSLVVVLANFSFLIGLVGALALLFNNVFSWDLVLGSGGFFLSICVVKLLADFVLLELAQRYFKQKPSLLLFSMFFYPVFLLVVIVWGLVLKTEWKQRGV